jgi:hypothetical protein
VKGFLQHSLLTSIGVDHGFGTVASSPRPHCLVLRQVHGTQVLSSGECRDRGLSFEGDGLVSVATSDEVGVFTADCLPVLAATESGRVVGAFHAGWRGAAARIVPEGIYRMAHEGQTLPTAFRVVLGPAIGPCCLTVGAEVWEAVASKNPTYSQRQRRTLDLWELVTHQLLEAGVPAENIGRISLCTRCHADLFFSHRGWGARRNGRSMLNYIRPWRDDRGEPR